MNGCGPFNINFGIFVGSFDVCQAVVDYVPQLSCSSLEPVISFDLVSTKLYCFRARVYCYYFFSQSCKTLRRASCDLFSELLRGCEAIRVINWDDFLFFFFFFRHGSRKL